MRSVLSIVSGLALAACVGAGDASEGTLVVSAHGGGTVYVDARPVEAARVRVSRGQHVVELRRGSLVVATEHVEVWGAEPVSVVLDGGRAAIAAADAAVSGRVEIRSLPPGAIVEIDGVRAGLGPLAIDLVPGPHVVLVWAPGYEPFEEEIFVSAGGATELDVRLQLSR